MQPQLLLLDEPMSALDAKMRKRLREDLKRLQAEIGFTAIFVTHDQEEALVLGDRIAVMHEGRFSQVGTATEIYNRPASRAVAEFIGEFNVLDQAMVRAAFGRDTAKAWALHPESIAVHAATPDDAATEKIVAKAVVTDRKLLGSTVRYQLAIGGINLKSDQLNKPSRALFEPGQSVCLVIDREDVRDLDS
jgi:putative spermidine/putrescine transport system ATP-binding protein